MNPDIDALNPEERSETHYFYDSIQGLVSIDESAEAILKPEMPQLLPAETTEENENLSLATKNFLNHQPDAPIQGESKMKKETDLSPIHALYEMGLRHHFKKEISQAIEALEKAYGFYLEHRSFLGAIECLIELAWIKYNQDKEEGLLKANRLFSEATKMINVHMSDPGVHEVRAHLLHYQGLVRYREKKYGDAVRNLMYAKNFCQGNSLTLARILDSLAVHYEQTNDYYRALQYAHSALEIKKQVNCTYEQAISYQIIGRLYIVREEYVKASEALVMALRISDEAEDQWRSARIKNELIRVKIYQNDITASLILIKEVEQDCQSREMSIPYGKSQFYKAYILYIKSDLKNAYSLLIQEVLPLFQKYDYRKGLAMAMRLLSCIHYHNGEEARAIQEMSEAICIFKEEGEITELAKTYYELGKIYCGLNEKKLALTSLLEGLQIAESNGLDFMMSHIEDQIFLLNESQWQEIVEKRTRHERVFEKKTNILEALSDDIDEEDQHELGQLKSGHPPSALEPNRRLMSLLRVGQAMAAERDLQKLLNLIRTETEAALDADRCTVFLYDRDANELWTKMPDSSGMLEERRFPAHLGLAGYVVKTGERVSLKNAYEDPRFSSEIDQQGGYRTQTLLCVPMRNRKMEMIGVFQVLNKHQAYFDQADEDLLMAISNNAGVAVENATLTQEMKISFDSFVKTLSSTIDARDPITAGHSERVAEYATLLGEEMALQPDDLEALRYASLLHDIGKIAVREDILKKDGRLTEKEYRHIQSHVYYTHEILKNVHFERHLQMVPEIAALHHEKMDGSGYYRGLKGEEILLPGRILAISDVFDAITSRRHYRNRMAFDKVLTILKRDTGQHFDAECVAAFFNIPLSKLGRILLMERNNATEGLRAYEKLDEHMTVGEYYKCLRKEAMSLGETNVHQLFSTLYHQQVKESPIQASFCMGEGTADVFMNLSESYHQSKSA